MSSENNAKYYLRYYIMSDFIDFLTKNKEINMKCVIVSGTLILGHAYLPKNIQAYLFIGFGSYVALAWYDHYNYCDLKLSANTILHPITASIKPDVDPETQLYL
jgi:hypothetical protein